MSDRREHPRGLRTSDGAEAPAARDLPVAADSVVRASARRVPDVTATQHATLWGLVRWPLISAQDLSVGLDGPARSTVYSVLAHLARHSLVEWVPYISSRAQHERLWYLTDAGVRLAAGMVSEDPASFARAWGLGESALVQRLGRLAHLTLSRGFLLDLQTALWTRHTAGTAGPLVTAWQPWPVTLVSMHRHRRSLCTLDGRGTLAWASVDPEPREVEIVLVWDDGGGLALEMLRPRLVALLRARATREQATVRAGAGAPTTVSAGHFPTVLLVAARPERARGAWSLAQDVARGERVRPLDLLLTSARAARRSGPADVFWRDREGRQATLAVLLAHRAAPASRHIQGVARPAVSDRPVHSRTEESSARGGSMLVQGQFARRSVGVLATLAGHRAGHTEPGPSAVAAGTPHSGSVVDPGGPPASMHMTRVARALVALALGPADRRLLRCLGLVPLATPETLATLTGDQVLPARSPARGWTTPRVLARLLRWGLCDYDLPGRIVAHAHRRYFLTPRGLVVLATLAGVSPATYCRLAGAIAGPRLPTTLPTRGRGGHPRRPRNRDRPHTGRLPTRVVGSAARRPRGVTRGSFRLAYYRRYAEHTEDVQAVFVALICAARTAVDQGHDHALEAWQFEWAAVRRYPHDGRWQTLRPDAYGRYRVGRRALAFFLEIDRGTSGLRNLAAKVAAYCAYRDSGLYARDPAQGGLVFPLVLVVTTGEERLRHILALAPTVAVDHLTRPLVVWVATASDLAAHSPLGPIWRTTSHAPGRRLFQEGGTTSERRSRITSFAKSRTTDATRMQKCGDA